MSYGISIDGEVFRNLDYSQGVRVTVTDEYYFDGDRFNSGAVMTMDCFVNADTKEQEELLNKILEDGFQKMDVVVDLGRYSVSGVMSVTVDAASGEPSVESGLEFGEHGVKSCRLIFVGSRPNIKARIGTFDD